MNWFGNLRTRSKLVLSFGAVLVLLGLATATSYIGITSLQASLHDSLTTNYDAVHEVLAARSNINRLASDTEGLLLTTDPSVQTALVTDITAKKTEFDGHLAKAKAIFQNSSINPDPALMTNISASYEAWKTTEEQGLLLVQ
jgi:CHASE3 domain sensor protein